MRKTVYKTKATVWVYPGEFANWHFVTLPQIIGKEIKQAWGSVAKGFGSLPVEVTIGATTWKTSIFPDKISKSYLLPLKAQVRKREMVMEGDTVSFSLKLLSV